MKIALALTLLAAPFAPALDPDPPPVAVTERLDKIDARLDRIEKALGTKPEKKAAVIPKPMPPAKLIELEPPRVAVVVPKAVARSYVTGHGHTHTCPSCGTVWDHGANASHNCPNCGTAQYVQDPGRATVRYQSLYTQSFSGCSGPGCAASQRGLFRWR